MGNQKPTWRRTVEKERKIIERMSWNEARGSARYRNRWNQSVKAVCATGHEDDK